MPDERSKITARRLQQMKASHERIAMLTAYDHSFARLLDEAGVDVLLVGDTLGDVVQGHPNTLSVTLDEMVYHARMVARVRRRALIVGDLPFGSYQQGPSQAVASAVRLVKEGGVEAVKLEGGVNVASSIEAIVAAEIPVMGHVGLTPQSYHRMGGYRVQGREAGTAPGQRQRLLADARAVEEAGAFAIVLEGIPLDLAAEITSGRRIPTIGIGAGPHCDGQVLVLHDLIGMSAQPPRFARAYARVADEVTGAASAFVADVRAGRFPSDAESYSARPPEPASERDFRIVS